MLVLASRTVARPSVIHVEAHAAQGPRGLVRLTPTAFALLSLLVSLPPDHVARYPQVAAILWPGHVGEPFDTVAGIRWHVHNLNRVLEQVGYAPRAIVAIDRVGLAFNPRLANETQTRRKR